MRVHQRGSSAHVQVRTSHRIAFSNLIPPTHFAARSHSRTLASATSSYPNRKLKQLRGMNTAKVSASKDHFIDATPAASTRWVAGYSIGLRILQLATNGAQRRTTCHRLLRRRIAGRQARR